MCRFNIRRFLFLTDEQIRQVFDNCRNLGICGAVFVAADWELSQIKSITSTIDVFNGLVFVFLVLVGIWLFFINQIQAFRKLKDGGIFGVKLALVGHIYNLVAVTLVVSIFLH